MARFLIESEAIRDGVARLSVKESRHAIKVLRLAAGDPVELFDGRGTRYQGRVLSQSDGRVAVRVEVSESAPRDAGAVWLGLSVIKFERMEWALEKACELGASRILPILARRSVVRLAKDRWPAKIARWERLAQASCKQCGLNRIPEITTPRTVTEALEESGEGRTALLPTLERRGMPVERAIASGRSGRWLVLIGPEGDFASEEVDAAVRRGAVPVSLGPLVLRAETAALAVLSALRFHLAAAEERPASTT